MTGSRRQPTGALHSRTIENSIAAAKKANTKVRARILKSIVNMMKGAAESGNRAARFLIPPCLIYIR